jgi:hypothetical protein
LGPAAAVIPGGGHDPSGSRRGLGGGRVEYVRVMVEAYPVIPFPYSCPPGRVEREVRKGPTLAPVAQRRERRFPKGRTRRSKDPYNPFCFTVSPCFSATSAFQTQRVANPTWPHNPRSRVSVTPDVTAGLFLGAALSSTVRHLSLTLVCCDLTRTGGCRLCTRSRSALGKVGQRSFNLSQAARHLRSAQEPPERVLRLLSEEPTGYRSGSGSAQAWEVRPLLVPPLLQMVVEGWRTRHGPGGG